MSSFFAKQNHKHNHNVIMMSGVDTHEVLIKTLSTTHFVPTDLYFRLSIHLHFYVILSQVVHLHYVNLSIYTYAYQVINFLQTIPTN